MTQPDKPTIEEALIHFGIPGMKWGHTTAGVAGVSSSTNRAAKKDAEEFTRAKLFYGQGAGTRRKLIKATVESKSKKDPAYKKAFDHHVANTDLGKRAAQAKTERKVKNTVNTTKKTARGVTHVLNGNSQAASASAALLVGGAMYAHKSGIDKVVINAARTHLKDLQNMPQRYRDARVVANLLRGSGL